MKFEERYQSIMEKSNKIDQIAEIAKDKNLVDMRNDLEKIFPKKSIDFSFSPVAHFRIKEKNGKTIIICNSKYADNPDKVVNNMAIGYEGKI